MNAPAGDINAAIMVIKQSLYSMLQLGVPNSQLQEVDSLLSDLEDAIDELPARITSQDNSLCSTCRYHLREIHSEPYGDGTAQRIETGCYVPDDYQCPLVKACGFEEQTTTAPRSHAL